MRNILLSTLAAATICVGVHQEALAGGAKHAAAPKKGHSWVVVDYSKGVCEPSPYTPDQVQTSLSGAAGHANGATADRIAPEDVSKDEAGNIHVTVRVTHDGEKGAIEFFTSADKCNSFLVDNGVQAEAANKDDIN